MDFAKKHWPILRQIDNKFCHRIKSFLIFGDQGEAVVFSTEDGETYWFGELKFDWNGWANCDDGTGCVPGKTIGAKSIQATKPTRLNVGNLVGMAQGRDHIVLLNELGQLYAFGLNDLGQLGQGTSDEDTHFKPELIPSSCKFVDVRCGWNYSVALADNGMVWTWGWNHCGQVGLPSSTTSYQASLHQISELNSHRIVAIECGDGHLLALTDQGKVFSWGRNQCGQLGHNNGDKCVVFGRHQHTPTQMETPGPISRIAAGPQHTLLLTEYGDVYVCGGNESGQLGLPNLTQTSATLRKVAGLPSPISEIGSHFGASISVAISSNQTCYVWGQLGNNDNCPTPLELPFKYSTIDSVLSTCIQPNTPHLVLVEDYKNGPKLIPPKRLMDRLSRMFDNPETSDIQFVVEGRTIYAHRPILQMSSVYFDRMFSPNWCPASGPNSRVLTITVQSYSYLTFYSYLRFIYTGLFHCTLEHIVELNDLANCYLEEELEQLCLEWILDNLSVENCCFFYQLTSESYLFGILNFRKSLIQFISDRFVKVTSTSAYKLMGKDQCQKLVTSISNQTIE